MRVVGRQLAMPDDDSPRAAEFFAGIGLVRTALDRAGFRVVFANDIDKSKRAMYAANFGDRDFILGDVREIHGRDVPDIELATASFPCTDLSLAGNRRGLAGAQSSMFWEFARILREMGDARRPPLALLENVPSFATSHAGEDLRGALVELNALGYWCDPFVVDARRFVPQSRPRLFIVCSRTELGDADDWTNGFRPPWLTKFRAKHPELRLQARRLSVAPVGVRTLADVVERMRPANPRWWDDARIARFVDSLSPVQSQRLAALRRSRKLAWATAYRRTRHGRAVWEIRPDAISGCLRTARGGSSKQALVEARRGMVRIRWMTPREYARLQGAPQFKIKGVSENQALFGFGDAVCVPVVEWLASEYLLPLVHDRAIRQTAALAASS